MKITLNIDSRGYTQKPSKQAGAISNRTRCAAAIRTIEPDDLLYFIEQGFTFTPAQIDGDPDEYRGTKDEHGNDITCSDHWRSQQVFAIDIDNTIDEIAEDGKHHKRQIKGAVDPDAARLILQRHGIKYYCMYNTFSNTDKWRKFRILIIIDAPVKDYNIAADIIKRLADIFNYPHDSKGYFVINDNEDNNRHVADQSIEPVKLIFGGLPDCIIDAPKEITSLYVLDRMPKYRAELPPTEAGTPKAGNYHEKRTTRIDGNLRALEQDCQNEINNFDLRSFIEQYTDGICSNRGTIGSYCPICGHRDCLEVTGAQYHCFSSNHPVILGKKRAPKGGGAAGNIIHFLQQLHNIDAAAAMQMFKFDIIGYDRDEWRQAWIDEQNANAGISSRAINDSANEWPAPNAQDAQEITSNASEQQELAEKQINEAPPPEDPAANQNNQQSKAPAKTKLQSLSAFDYLDGGQYDADIDYLKQFSNRKMRMHDVIDDYLTLYPGLAVLGGSPSLGKTTFCVNMVSALLDNDESHEHVLYFALEQRPYEILTKSLARQCYVNNPGTAITNIQLHDGYRDQEIYKAIKDFKKIADRYHIIACNFETTAADIIDYVEQYRKNNGGDNCRPIVIIDYLQLVAPPADAKGSLRENIDENLKAFKRMQQDNGLFVLLISSFNRSANINAVNYDSFKETGMIESTCDYVWGLQLTIQDADNEDFYTVPSGANRKDAPEHLKRKKIAGASTMTPKRVEFVSLKSRKGKQIYKACFNYYPAHDYYEADYNPPAYARMDGVIKRTPKAGRRV